jgi:2-amino-4-hydroxy-6-hydroxymethyldihydropteridine diphosphokinase
MRVWLSLGSNVGDRAGHLAVAVSALRSLKRTEICAVSRRYETEPIGKTGQPAFLNMAVEIETELAPLELLNACQEIEARLGRERSEHWGPRTIDIDLILCGPLVITTERLTAPHPEFRKRNFVLAPLAEIAPEAVDPVTGKTVAELAALPEAQGRVWKLDDSTP